VRRDASPDHDVAIVGSGFAGSILARVLRRAGRRVLLIERARHPRFALGESSTPLAALALERLAARYDLPDLHQLAAYGRWTSHLPHLRRGLKRGFTFFHHRPHRPWRNDGRRNDARLLVAASPEDAVADAHWLRADVDHHLVEQARREGVDYRDETTLEGVEIEADGVRLSGRHRRRTVAFRAALVIDASGAGGFLARRLPIAGATDRMRLASALLYAHFDGVRPFTEVAAELDRPLPPGPYPDDRAAVHHLLEEGWAYVLPFDHGPASCGVLLQHLPPGWSAGAARRRPAALWRSLLQRYPGLAAQLGPAEPITPLRFVPRIQHRLARAAGRRWLLLPHAFAFVDPLFSTGMAWSLLAVERIAALVEGRWGDEGLYGRLLAREADQIEVLVAAAYRARHRFDLFAALSSLYFACVSHEELRQRLAPAAGGTTPDAWRGFLGAGDPARRALFRRVLAELERLGPSPDDDACRAFRRRLAARVAPFDVIGLDEPARRNLHPVDLEVVIERAARLGLRRETVLANLPRLRGDQPPQLR